MSNVKNGRESFVNLKDCFSYKKIFYIYDEEVKNVEMFFFAKNDVVATRLMTDFVNSGKCPYVGFLNKMVVYSPGYYCEQTGDIILNKDGKKRFYSLNDFLQKE